MIMAGMLPGVECARRRRIHRGGGSAADPASSSSRRSSFCLYATAHDQIHLSSASTSTSTSSSTSTKRSILNKEIHDGALGNVAREAKERLDAKLMAIRRHNSTGRMKTHKNEGGGREEEQQQTMIMMMLGNVQREVFSSKKKSLKKLGWSKLGWKSSEQAECVVCLEEFRAGEVLVHLPCAHRFHWECAAPWLESRSQCPCCRTSILSK